MNKSTEQLLLKNFFSGYFHEDWICDADSPDAVVAEFARNANPIDMQALREAILGCSRGFENEHDLEEKLFTDLGCYYRPSVDGLSAKSWLEHISNELLKAANK